MAICEGKKSSNDITNNDTMSEDEVVASYVPPRYLLSLCTCGYGAEWYDDEVAKVLRFRHGQHENKLQGVHEITQRILYSVYYASLRFGHFFLW